MLVAATVRETGPGWRGPIYRRYQLAGQQWRYEETGSQLLLHDRHHGVIWPHMRRPELLDALDALLAHQTKAVTLDPDHETPWAQRALVLTAANGSITARQDRRSRAECQLLVTPTEGTRPWREARLAAAGWRAWSFVAPDAVWRQWRADLDRLYRQNTAAAHGARAWERLPNAALLDVAPAEDATLARTLGRARRHDSSGQ